METPAIDAPAPRIRIPPSPASEGGGILELGGASGTGTGTTPEVAPRVALDDAGRPLLVSTCVLAMKIMRDEAVQTSQCARSLDSELTALDPWHLLELERLVLRILGYRIPAGAVYQTYANALFGAANDATLGDGFAVPDMLEGFS